MRASKHTSRLCLMLFLALTTSARSGEQSTMITQGNGHVDAVLTSVADIERDLSTNSAISTQHLIQTLAALQSQDLSYSCARVNVTEEERLRGPPKYDTFLKVVRELASRGGEPVRQGFQQVLLGEKLAPREKCIVRSFLREDAGKDTPFTLPATDRTQKREYLLRFDPKMTRTVEVHKGDVLVQIARRAYPQLSQWAAVDALVFINDLKNPETLHPNQRLNIYDYEVIRDLQASWVKPNDSADH